MSCFLFSAIIDAAYASTVPLGMCAKCTNLRVSYNTATSATMLMSPRCPVVVKSTLVDVVGSIQGALFLQEAVAVVSVIEGSIPHHTIFP
jgi:hypothetical protein